MNFFLYNKNKFLFKKKKFRDIVNFRIFLIFNYLLFKSIFSTYIYNFYLISIIITITCNKCYLGFQPYYHISHILLNHPLIIWYWFLSNHHQAYYFLSKNCSLHHLLLKLKFRPPFIYNQLPLLLYLVH